MNRISELERVLGQKTMENEILKKAVRIGREKKLLSQKLLSGVDGFRQKQSPVRYLYLAHTSRKAKRPKNRLDLVAIASRRTIFFYLQFARFVMGVQATAIVEQQRCLIENVKH